ncbi:MAG: hypothetical protein DMG13_13330 [Acidobacteria bacterium]|nr:MAG: hypothetical protein DMG13_13330 [Acidobacteriota bacterium]
MGLTSVCLEVSGAIRDQTPVILHESFEPGAEALYLDGAGFDRDLWIVDNPVRMRANAGLTPQVSSATTRPGLE